MGEEAEDDLYRAEVYDDPFSDEEDSDEYNCPIHGECGGYYGECPRC